MANTITDHEFLSYYPKEHAHCCQYVYKPDNPLYADPSGGWMMGGPIECGGSPERHAGYISDEALKELDEL